MNHTFQTLEFDLIIDKLIELACTEGAKERIRNLTPVLNESEVKRTLRDTTQARMILDRMGLPPAVSMNGLSAIFTTVRQGGFLLPEELEAVGTMLTGVKRYKEFLNRCKYLELSLPYFEENLNPLEELARQLYESIRGGRVDDMASKYLKSIRQELNRLEERLRTKAESMLRGNKKYYSDTYITIRNGRVCLPVKKEYKSAVPGSVIDQSSTGSTLFIEPSVIVSMNGELENLRIEEDNEVRRILYTLTGLVEEQLFILTENMQVLEKLDFLFAKAKLSASMNGVEPLICTDRIIRIANGRHPFMNPDLVVPLDFELGFLGTGIVITGPNTGGKTVTIKTVGLFSLMAQCGLHLPCETGELCLFNHVLCDIGDGQNITESLSTFSAHIKNVLTILKNADGESLVLLDELGSGTDPAEGMGIAISILEELRESGCLFLATTHYPEVKIYAKETKGITNARMAFDRESLKPLYRLEIGEAGESCALYIAERLGMPKRMIHRAKKYAYGEEMKEPIGDETEESFKKTGGPRIERIKKPGKNQAALQTKFTIGDSVLVYPDKKIGIVCTPVNDKGVLRIQMPDKKIWINHKRIKLLVAAAELYPEDYDFSILFDTVENRKLRHKMEKGFQEGLEIKNESEQTFL